MKNKETYSALVDPSIQQRVLREQSAHTENDILATSYHLKNINMIRNITDAW